LLCMMVISLQQLMRMKLTSQRLDYLWLVFNLIKREMKREKERRLKSMIKRENTMLNRLIDRLISIRFGFILVSLVMLLFGYNPIDAYNAMLTSVLTNPYFFGEALRQAVVLTFTGLGFNMAYQAGFFNIGIAGQMLLGWLTSIWFALMFPDLPRLLSVPLFLIIGLLAGAIWAGIAGFLRAYFGTNEVIVTIMLNYTALHFSNY